MEIGVARSIFTHRYTKGSIGQRYPYYKKWEKHIVIILHIYGAIATFLLFCDHQDTELEKREMVIDVFQSIPTQKNSNGSTGPGYSSTTI